MPLPRKTTVLVGSSLLVLLLTISSAKLAARPVVVDIVSEALKQTVNNKRRQRRRAAVRRKRRSPLTYVEAGSNQWNRRVLCLIKGDKLYMFRHAEYLGHQGNVFQLLNHPMEHYPEYHVFGVPNRSYVTFPRTVVIDRKDRLFGIPLWSRDRVPDIAVLDLKARTVQLRSKKKLTLSSFDLPREVVISRRKAGRYDDGFGGATRHLYPENYEVIRLHDEVSWVFWRYHADLVPALAGKVVVQSYSRPFEFTIEDE